MKNYKDQAGIEPINYRGLAQSEPEYRHQEERKPKPQMLYGRFLEQFKINVQTLFEFV